MQKLKREWSVLSGVLCGETEALCQALELKDFVRKSIVSGRN